MTPAIGSLRDLVRFEARTSTSDGMGGTVAGWSVIASGIPARISPVKGGEEVRAQRLSGLSPFDIWIRWTAALATALTPACRAVDQRTGRTFNIKWVADLDGRKAFLVMTAVAGGLTDA